MPASGPTPPVSYVMPVLNEVAHLEQAVESVLGQAYAGRKEIVLALGPSTDGTNGLAHALAAEDPRIVLVDNPGTDIPLGMNLAIDAAHHDIIVRVDAHSVLPQDYTTRVVAALERTGAANVGGVMRATGRSPLQRAVARAYNSPLGLGGGAYHGGSVEGPAESAYLGTFRRAVLREVGGYDPTLKRAEDYELNQRIIAAGHDVWFLPDLEVTYFPRASWEALAKQMWATGAWRGELVRRVRRSGVRYLVPPALVLGLGGGLGCGAAVAAGAPGWFLLGLVPTAAYAVFLAAAATVGLRSRRPADIALNVGVLATMHVSWGAGFLKGLFGGAGSTVDRSRLGGPLTAPPAPPAG